jgi:hypothetical protein
MSALGLSAERLEQSYTPLPGESGLVLDCPGIAVRAPF